ncbi:hypothetical protein MAM1_0118d05783 [Mucor ambiguus]|uniref:Uncharacterized protein n=1 Tax=Mucor ambiguus TaxID=91626 RepID=A0A0C9MW22_9FUNG|nr:hypothetical protein MAM1_0118d05783 [Mucor ambiguus]
MMMEAINAFELNIKYVVRLGIFDRLGLPLRLADSIGLQITTKKTTENNNDIIKKMGSSLSVEAYSNNA